MAKIPDRLETALSRLDDMLAARDQRTHQILSFHAAIEQQMDVELEALLPNGSQLRTRLGFSQKIDVLLSATDNPFMPDLGLALIAFNNLRNCVAHGEPSRVVDGHLERFRLELARTYLDFNDPEPPTLHEAAAMLVGALASLSDVEVMITLLGWE